MVLHNRSNSAEKEQCTLPDYSHTVAADPEGPKDDGIACP